MASESPGLKYADDPPKLSKQWQTEATGQRRMQSVVLARKRARLSEEARSSVGERGLC